MTDMDVEARDVDVVEQLGMELDRVARAEKHLNGAQEERMRSRKKLAVSFPNARTMIFFLMFFLRNVKSSRKRRSAGHTT